MPRARLLSQLRFDGETEETIRAALDAHDAEREEAGRTESGAGLWIQRRDALYLEWLTITGKLIDDIPR